MIIFGQQELYKKNWKTKIGLDSYYIVAKQNQEIIGFAGIIKIIDEVNIMNIVVRKDKRKEGIGSKLLNKIFEIAKEKNAQTITLEVNEKNLPAIRLYQKFGFEQTGLRKKYYHNMDNAIIMSVWGR